MPVASVRGAPARLPALPAVVVLRMAFSVQEGLVMEVQRALKPVRIVAPKGQFGIAGMHAVVAQQAVGALPATAVMRKSQPQLVILAVAHLGAEPAVPQQQVA